MANRILRDWTDSEKVDLLSFQGEVFFLRLFMKADDYGCYHGNPKLLRASLYPLRLDSIREADLQRWIAECVNAGLIVLYESADKPYLRIVNFGQRLRSMKHRFPTDDGNSRTIVSDLRTDDGDPPPEEREKGKLNPKPETNPKEKAKAEISLSDFEGLFDDLWKETISMMPVHKGKNLNECIQKAYLHLQAGGRLARGTTQDFKQCVQSFLNNERPSNGHQFKKPKAFNLSDV